MSTVRGARGEGAASGSPTAGRRRRAPPSPPPRPGVRPAPRRLPPAVQGSATWTPRLSPGEAQRPGSASRGPRRSRRPRCGNERGTARGETRARRAPLRSGRGGWLPDGRRPAEPASPGLGSDGAPRTGPHVRGRGPRREPGLCLPPTCPPRGLGPRRATGSTRPRSRTSQLRAPADTEFYFQSKTNLGLGNACFVFVRNSIN